MQHTHRLLHYHPRLVAALPPHPNFAASSLMPTADRKSILSYQVASRTMSVQFQSETPAGLSQGKSGKPERLGAPIWLSMTLERRPTEMSIVSTSLKYPVPCRDYCLPSSLPAVILKTGFFHTVIL